MIWPTVRLQSLEMKSNASVLSSVRCVLSNGISSPVFENENAGVKHDQTEIINLDPSRQIRFLQAYDDGSQSISRVFFMDESNEEITSYNPFEMKKKGPMLKLRPTETVLGVYGVNDK